MPERLKPCPFCGADDIRTYEPTLYEPNEESEIRCQNPLCGAEVRGLTSKMAIAKWNRRVGE